MISKSMIITVDQHVIGAVQSLSIANDNRIVLGRARFDKFSLSKAFSRNFFHKDAQKLPFQIEVTKENGDKFVIQNAWIAFCNSTYTNDNWIIVEKLELEAEKIPEELLDTKE